MWKSRCLGLVVVFAGCSSTPADQGDAAVGDGGGNVDATTDANADVTPIVDASSDASDASSLQPPAGALAGGFTTNTFSDDFATLGTIDLDNTQNAGFDWYVTCWFCGTVTAKSSLSIVNGALRMTSGALYGQLAGKNGVVGKSFTKGAYFEARLAFALPADNSKSWPSFWALPNLDKTSIAWPGNTTTVNFNNTQEHYNDSMEVDILEFMPLTELQSDAGIVSSTLHDWYGYPGVTCPVKTSTQCQVASSTKANDTTTLKYESSPNAPVFHNFGALWVAWDPSTPNTPGYIQFYVDDEPIGTKTTWTGVPPSKADPSGILPETTVTNWPNAALPPWTMGAVDLDAHALILDTGGNAFMDVQWVRVWQK